MFASGLDWVAIYGAVLSTVVAIAALWSARPRLRVKFEVGNFHRLQYGVYLTVRNPTGHAAYIDAVGVKYTGGAGVLDSKLTGVRLDPHSVVRMYLTNEQIQSMLSGGTSPYMRAFAIDALGRTTYGPLFDMTEFREAESDEDSD